MRSVFLLFALVMVGLGVSACTEPGQTEIARGNVLASQGQMDQAIREYETAAKVMPGKARPLELKGHVLFDQQKFELARQAYQQAIEAEESSAIEARIGLARIDAEQNRVDPAIGQLDKVIAAQPNNVYARLSRANLAMRRAGPGDVELALTDTAEAMKVDPTNASVLYARGCAFIARKDEASAREAFRKIEEHHPRSPLASYGLARLAAHRERRSEVVVHLREAKAKARHARTGSWAPEAVRLDPAFQHMKDDPELLQLLEEQ